MVDGEGSKSEPLAFSFYRSEIGEREMVTLNPFIKDGLIVRE